MKITAIFATLIVAAISASALSQTATLKQTHKKGDKTSYKMVGHSTSTAGEADITGTMTSTVLSVADDGGYTEEANVDLHITIPTGEIPIQRTSKNVYNAAGELTDMSGEGLDDATKTAAQKSEGIQSFHAPTTAVKVGDSWTYEAKPGSNNGQTGTKITYKVEGAEDVAGHHVFKVHGTGSQTGGSDATLDGTYWIDTTSGVMVKAQGTTKHEEVMESIFADTTYTLTLQE